LEVSMTICYFQCQRSLHDSQLDFLFWCVLW
jgi:hypothetical protein